MSNLRIQPLDGGTRLAVFFAADREITETETKLWHPRPSRRPPPPLPPRALSPNALRAVDRAKGADLSAERAAPRRS